MEIFARDRQFLNPADASLVPARRAAGRLDQVGLLIHELAGPLGREALEQLYDMYARRVYGLGITLLGDVGLAEELVQETFLRLWRSASMYDHRRGSGCTFMFTIARRVAIDLRRRPSSRSLTEPYQVEAELIGPDSAEELVIGLVVRDVLDALSDSHRQILELTFLEDLSQKEVADRLGIPVGTVKSRTYHAIRAFTRAASENDL